MDCVQFRWEFRPDREHGKGRRTHEAFVWWIGNNIQTIVIESSSYYFVGIGERKTWKRCSMNETKLYKSRLYKNHFHKQNFGRFHYSFRSSVRRHRTYFTMHYETFTQLCAKLWKKHPEAKITNQECHLNVNSVSESVCERVVYSFWFW